MPLLVTIGGREKEIRAWKGREITQTTKTHTEEDRQSNRQTDRLTEGRTNGRVN